MIVQDDTGLIADANSYVSVAFADGYLGGRGEESTWVDMDEDQKEIALVIGTEYADKRFGFRGRKKNGRTQPTEFPRINLSSEGENVTEVPSEVKKAACLYALSHINGALVKAQTGASREIKKEKVTVGPITTETEYMEDTGDESYLDLTLPDSYLEKFRSLGGNVVPMMRG